MTENAQDHTLDDPRKLIAKTLYSASGAEKSGMPDSIIEPVFGPSADAILAALDKAGMAVGPKECGIHRAMIADAQEDAKNAKSPPAGEG